MHITDAQLAYGMDIKISNQQRHPLTVTIGEEGLMSISSPQAAIVSAAHLLLPRLAPAFLNCADPSDDEAIGAPPRLEDGRLDEEDARSGRRCFRLTGILRHPVRREHRLYYEARVSLGRAPLIEVEYARVRSLDGRITLTHWEHHLLLDSCDSVLFEALDEPRQVAVFDLVLGPGSGAEALAVRDRNWWLVLASSDLGNYREGAFSLRSDPERPGVHHFGLHRISPDWAYSGAIHQSLESIDLPDGGALSASFTLEVQSQPPLPDALHPSEGGRYNETPGSPEAEVLYLHRPPPRDTVDKNARLAERIREKIEFFTITGGRLHGLHWGGYCHINKRHLEAPVNRAEYAEYMLNEYVRSGDAWWLERVLEFARAHLDLMYLTREPDPLHGGVRHRGTIHVVTPIRSCRTANLLLNLYAMTGDEVYRRAAIANGDYLLRHVVDAQARQAAACRELAALWRHTGEERFAQGARTVVDRVASYQETDGSWHQVYNPDGSVTERHKHEAGEYSVAAPRKPEMASYNIIGMLDMVTVLPYEPAEQAARRALDWLVSVQSEAGGWRFPAYNSVGLWGHGAFQDAHAMFLGYGQFGDQRYLTAGTRVFSWAVQLLEERGYIPTVVGFWPYEQTEASLSYFYGLEALAALRSLKGNQ